MVSGSTQERDGPGHGKAAAALCAFKLKPGLLYIMGMLRPDLLMSPQGSSLGTLTGKREGAGTLDLSE